MGKKQGKATVKERAKVFNSLICRGKVRAAIRYISEREKGGVFLPGDTDDKTGEEITAVLESKHPEGRDVEPSKMPIFDSCPEMMNSVVTGENVEKVAKKLSGSAGASGTDSIAMSHWLLKYSGASLALRNSIAKLTEWLANGYPPWAAYRAMIYCRLIALKKCPGVRPIGIGDIFRRLVCNVFLSITRNEAIRACDTDQLCCGLEADIEGGIHHVRFFVGRKFGQ